MSVCVSTCRPTLSLPSSTLKTKPSSPPISAAGSAPSSHEAGEEDEASERMSDFVEEDEEQDEQGERSSSIPPFHQHLSLPLSTPSSSPVFPLFPSQTSGNHGMMTSKFGTNFGYCSYPSSNSATSSPWPTYGSTSNNNKNGFNGPSSSFLLHANTPPIAPNSILFSPAGLPPRHQPILDTTNTNSSNLSYSTTLPSGDYFTLISPSGTVQSLPHQQQQFPQATSLHHATAAPPSCPSMIRPSDLMLHSTSAASRPKLSHLAPLSRMSSSQQCQGSQQQGWTGPFSHAAPAQPSNLSNSMTMDSDSNVLSDNAKNLASHNRGLSTSSFTSTTSSLATDSLTWSPGGSPTSSSFGSTSQASSFQQSDNFMTQNASNAQASYAHPAYTYGNQQDFYRPKELYPSSSFGLIQQDVPFQFHPVHMRQSPLPMQPQSLPMQDQQSQHFQQPQQQQYLQPEQYTRDSVSPVQMSLSPQPNSGVDLSIQIHSGPVESITPTRSQFNLVAPTPRVPSVMRRNLVDISSLSAPSSDDDVEDVDEDVQVEDTVAGALDRSVQARDQQYHMDEGARQLRKGRSGANLSMTAMSIHQQSNVSISAPNMAPLQSIYNHNHSYQQNAGIALPAKIKALGTLPADEAFSASLEQLDDVSAGTKPPYLWWTLIRAAILGAPGQKLQMETLTQLIQQKYP